MPLNVPPPSFVIPPSSELRLGLIAGNGALPLAIARAARRMGPARLAAVGHVGETDPALAGLVDEFLWVKLGQFGKIIRFLRQQRVDQALFAGGIVKASLWRGQVWPDGLALRVIARLHTLDDDVLLRAIAGELESQGIRVCAASEWVPDWLAPTGVLGGVTPSGAEWDDLAHGWRIAKALGGLDIGQGVVVRQKAVVAVEAVEGTDAMIERAGQLTGGSGGVLVKVCKPQQDQRLDLPSVGPRTVANLHRAGLRVLGVEAGATLILDPETTLRAADRLGVAVVGLEGQQWP